MTYKMEITSLSHEDIVAMTADIVYASHLICFEYDKEKYHELFQEGDCIEDKMARILLNGGQITVIDMESYDDIEDDAHYDVHGIPNENWRTHKLIPMNSWTGEEYKVIGYNVDLRTIIMGINKSNRAQDLAKTLLVDEEGDLPCAESLMQCIVYGEEIYG